MRTLATRVTTPWDVTLALALVIGAVAETLVVTSAPDPGARAALAAVTLTGLAVRRRLPVTMTAVVSFGMATESLFLEAPDEMAVLLGLVVASYSVAAHAPLREALTGAALLSMGLAVTIAVDPSDSKSNIVPSLLLFIVLPVLAGISVYRRKRDIAVLQLEAAALIREADAAVDAERRRIARELHDVVSHAVTLIAVQAEAGQAVLDRDIEAARKSLASIGDVSREALDELGRLLALLRDEESTNQTEAGLARMSALVKGARAAGLTVTIHEEGVRRPLPPAADHCAYRVVQEGLTNALRHASGAKVNVLCSYDTDEVRIRVDSEGKRHSSAYGGTGRGLVGLRERVLGLGGSLEADPTPGGNFGLRATLPAPTL